MNALTQKAALAQLVAHNPNVIAAWIGSHSHAQTLQILTDSLHVPGHLAVTVDGKSVPIVVPEALAKLPYHIQHASPFHDLRAHAWTHDSAHPHQVCQDEPVQLGTQLQPAGAPWVGTAGLPVHWLDRHSKPFWGFLSNWHVMCGGPTAKGHPQHQPTDQAPALGYLADWNQVTGQGINYLDAAIARADVDGLHTISQRILGIVTPLGDPADAEVGIRVVKSGRTTGVTMAACTAIGASVRVSYGDFTATFADQDIFESADTPFSGPGDSGSCILSDTCRCPLSLLFAGGGNLTIGNPFRYAIERFNLTFPFN